jgi:hypothetical protein
LNDCEQKYGITELETLAVVWGMSFSSLPVWPQCHHLHGPHRCESSLKARNQTAKYARWWTRVYGRGVKSIKIQYHAGRENSNADALSCSPYLPAPAVGISEDEVQVSTIAAADSLEENPYHPQSLSLGFTPGPTCDQHGFQQSTE